MDGEENNARPAPSVKFLLQMLKSGDNRAGRSTFPHSREFSLSASETQGLIVFQQWVAVPPEDKRRPNVYSLHVLVRPQCADTNDPAGHAGAQNRPTTVREMLSHYDSEATHRMSLFVCD